MNRNSGFTTELQGWRLLVARGVWLVLVAFSIGLYLLLIPINLRNVNIYFQWDVSESYYAVSQYISRKDWGYYVVTLRYVTLVVYLSTALLVFWRRSRDWWALFVSLTLVVLPALLNLAGSTDLWYVYFDPPWDWFWRTVKEFITQLGVLCLFGLFYLFPDGRFAPRRIRWVALLSALGVTLSAVLSGQEDEKGWALFAVTVIATLTIASAGQIYRYFRVSTPSQRQQTKLVVFGLATAGFTWPIWGLGIFLLPSGYARYQTFISLHLNILAFGFIPLTIMISMLRYRLWDFDRLVNRALVYGALSGLILTLYALVVGIAGTLFQLQSNLVIATLATGLVAVLFHPLRRQMQGVVNRFMYGERDDPQAVLSRMGERLENVVEPDRLLPAVVETVAQTLKLPYCAIELHDERPVIEARDDDGPTADGNDVDCDVQASPVISWGDEPPTTISLPLTYQGRSVGRLRVAPREREESLTPADLRLLQTVAHQVGAAAYAVRLTADLQRSREQLVVARESERRRLRRDLHDGLGPQLASLTLKLDAARNLLVRDPDAADRLLVELKGQTQATIADIRRLVYDLRPPKLDQLGLLSAIREFASMRDSSNGLRVTVEAPEQIPPLAAAVEVAAYRVALEALTNVERHAQARHCRVALCVNGQIMTLEIEDDGAGFAPDYRAGVGLASMRERAEELGGSLRVENRPEGGARVRADLPLIRGPR